MTHYTDYMMILSLPDRVVTQVYRYKRASMRVIGGFESQHSQAHISVFGIGRQNPVLVQHSLMLMEKKLRLLRPIELRINNFAFFNQGSTGRTIYAVIEFDPATQTWFKQLKSAMGVKMAKIVPHITIAKNIPMASFYKLWPHFERSGYCDAFSVSHLTVLERESYQALASWRVYKELYFAGGSF